MAPLKKTIEGLLTLAGKKPGTPARKELRNGLRVDVMVKNDTVHLQLSRGQKWPGDHEFTTVLKYWPWPAPAELKPERKEHDGRCYLRTAFPVQTRLALAFEPGYSIRIEPQDAGISLTVYDAQQHWVESDWANNPREARFKAEQLAKKYDVDTRTIPELFHEETAAV